jgi:FKBP-type peptidyl-prolyl cis-trans isomerase
MNLKLVAVLGILLFAAQASTAEPSTLKTPKDKVDYAIGVDIARNFQKMGVEVNLDVMVKGLKDGFAGKKILMSDDEIRQTLSEYQTQTKIKRSEAAKSAAQGNKKQGEAFLAQNKAKEGVVTLPSGLQYKILKAGEGKKPTEADLVEVNYRGTLIDGTEFDSSYKRGQTATFKLANGVIRGFKEALLLMPVGSKWQVVIPPELAYGERGTPPKIGPNATLVFELELLAIKQP